MWLIIIISLIAIKLLNKLTTGRCYSDNVMTGKVAIVTGANSGIGYETALELARRGAKVILACRDDEKGKLAVNRITRLTKNYSIRYQYLDLSSLHSIRDFVEEYTKHEAKLDVLINNAGAIGMVSKKTEDGIVRDMQVNHFGPFLLTLLLVPILRKSAPSRVINVSSSLHTFGNTNALNSENVWFLKLYANSKLCNILFSKELARRLEGTGIVVNSLHPGYVNTSLFRSTIIEKLRCLVLYAFFKSPEEGAQTSVHLAVSDDCDQVSGKYFAECAESKPCAKAEDKYLAEQLWTLSEELVMLKPEERIRIKI